MQAEDAIKYRDYWMREHDKALDQLFAANKRPDELAEALTDCLGGFAFIKRTHGKLYGVGWERVEDYASLIAHKSPAPDKAVDDSAG